MKFDAKKTTNEIIIFIVYTLGFYYILNNHMSVTDLVTFSSLMLFFLEPIKNILDMIPRINYIKSTMTKVNEFMYISKERLGEYVDINEVLKALTEYVDQVNKEK